MTQQSLKHDIILSFLVGFSFCFLFCYNLALNPFTLYSGYDQSIFEQMGLGMLQGRIPYVDLFDHKGFLLYIINATGLLLSPNHTGIYCLQSLSLALTFFCWLRISDRIVHPSLRYVAPAVSLLFALTCEGGNMTETWSLPWISIPIYYLVRYLSGERIINLREYFITGICIGLVANLRLNNIVPAVAVYIYMFYDLCLRREFQKLTCSTLTVFGGFSFATLALVFLYVALYGTQHLQDYWFCNVGFNLLYVDCFSHEPLWKAAGFYFPLSMLILMICSRRNWTCKLTWFTLAASLLTLLTTGTAYFAHYFTIFSPFVVLSIALSIGNKPRISPRCWRFIGVSCMFLLAGLVGIFHTEIQQIQVNYIARENAIAESSQLLGSLDKEQKASIWNYNTMMAGSNLLSRERLVQSNRIFLPFQTSGNYGVEEKGTLEEVHPKIILLDERTRWDKLPATDALESKGSPEDSAFISRNYRLLHRCSVPIHGKIVCILSLQTTPHPLE